MEVRRREVGWVRDAGRRQGVVVRGLPGCRLIRVGNSAWCRQCASRSRLFAAVLRNRANRPRLAASRRASRRQVRQGQAALLGASWRCVRGRAGRREGLQPALCSSRHIGPTRGARPGPLAITARAKGGGLWRLWWWLGVGGDACSFLSLWSPESRWGWGQPAGRLLQRSGTGEDGMTFYV